MTDVADPPTNVLSIPVRFLRNQLNLLTEDELAAVLDLRTTNTLATWRADGVGPQYVKLGRKVFYTRADVDDWVQAQRFIAPDNDPA